MALSLVTPPAIEPLTVEEVQRHLKITREDADDYAYLWRLIVAAREEAERVTQRAMLTQTRDLTLDAFPCDTSILLPYPPLVSVTSVKYVDQAGTLTTWPSTNYLVYAPAGPRCRRGRISLVSGVSWPSTITQAGAVTIRFVCGHATAADVSAMYRVAMLQDIAAWYANPEPSLISGAEARWPGSSTNIYRGCKSR